MSESRGDAPWTSLAAFKTGGVPPGYPANIRALFAPQDDIPGVLKALLSSATQSLAIAMFGYDDDLLDAIIRSKLDDSHVAVQMSLDLSQSLGAHEKAILAKWSTTDASNSVAVGKSAKGSISHLKMCVIDGRYVIHGSTNWSTDGEVRQNNELLITQDLALAQEATSLLNTIHAQMLAQAKKGGS